ncbi:tabinhibitin 10-like isoform X2 [Drosophila gunungcola]|uniref:SCP domain-containing protein n=1 Tax=Drosophila gunungcola TaxID=103775 RepID=A0A9Q0BQ31_9MUSC|nr:tabinhibitin 10-like isoform X2 [Drosophila gunungcola]XP_052838589.1 tabinhibitin 10-like isoform X2 [Drosophila gunungcola]KAI8039634.1 hypothetical protein M5D96_007054 [Drosophila gunungcola]
MIRSLVIPVILLLPLASGYNYCNNKTHRCVLEGKEHFMCRLDKFRPLLGSTIYHAIVPDVPYLQDQILRILNQFRNSFAGGELATHNNKTFASAKRMRKLIWDKELAYMARTHASTVSLQHSECRSTQRFAHVGEVLFVAVPNARAKINYILETTFRSLFQKYLKVEDPEGLLVGFDPIRDFNLADLTIIISDRVSRVGCGLASGSNCNPFLPSNFCLFLTCHFDFVNLNGSYVYKAGEPASGCDDWYTTGSNKYVNLCRNNGDIYPPDQGDNSP